MKHFKTIIKTITVSLIIALLLFLVYFFYQPQVIFTSNLEISNPFYDYVKDFPLWLYLVIYFIVISFINIFIFIVLSFYFDYIRNKKQNAIAKYEQFFTKKLSEYLITESHKDEESLQTFKKSLKPKLKKKSQIIAFFNIYTKIQETLVIDFSDDFNSLIRELNLSKKLRSLLFSSDFSNKILALKTLSYIRNTEYLETFLKYSKSKNYAVRTEAIAAIYRIKSKTELKDFTIGERHLLSLIDINVIVNAIIKNKKTALVNHEALIKSNKDRKKILGLLLSKFQLTKSPADLVQNATNDEELINKVEWNTLLALLDTNEATEEIISRYFSESEDVKLSILHNSFKINNSKFNQFLTDVIEKEPLLHKVTALKILFNNDLSIFAKYMGSKNHDIAMAFKEVSDVHIN